MKTKEELNALKEEAETLNSKLAELTEEELDLVSGGRRAIFFCSGQDCGGALAPYCPNSTCIYGHK